MLDWNDRSSWVSLDRSSWVWVLPDRSLIKAREIGACLIGALDRSKGDRCLWIEAREIGACLIGAVDRSL